MVVVVGEQGVVEADASATLKFPVCTDASVSDPGHPHTDIWNQLSGHAHYGHNTIRLATSLYRTSFV